MYNRLLFGTAIIAILSFSIAMSAAAEPLKFGIGTWVGFGPLFIAKDRGFFEEEGVEVELITTDDQAKRFAQLDAGEINALATTVDTVLSYVRDEHAYRYLFAFDDSKGGDGIISSREIQSFADLKGKAVAYREGSVAQFATGVLLNEAGLGLEDIKSVNLGAGDAAKAFFSGEVDAAYVIEPWLSQAKASKTDHILWDSSLTPGLIVDIAVTTPEQLDAHADAFKALYRAWIKALKWQRENENEADVIMAKGLGGWLEDPEILKDARGGIAYYDEVMNKEYIGSFDAPGGIIQTIGNAIELGRNSGLFNHQITPIELVMFDIANQ